MKFSLGILIFILLVFLITLFTKLTLAYVLFGPLLLLAIRIPYRKPNISTAFSIGLNAAIWPYIIYQLLSLFVFRAFCICPFIHLFGLAIIPVFTGVMTAVLNFIPESQSDKNKPDLFKNYKFQLF